MRPCRFIVLLLSVALYSACGVHGQKRGINHARTMIAASGEAIDATDGALVKQYKDTPASDTKSYCIVRKSALILEQAKAVVYAAADSVRLWELALMHYQAEKKAGDDDRKAWKDVLSAQASWMAFATEIIGVIDAVIKTLSLYGVDLPPQVGYVWQFVENFGPREWSLPDWDWEDLKGSVCMEGEP
jgi:hypothetical protein